MRRPGGRPSPPTNLPAIASITRLSPPSTQYGPPGAQRQQSRLQSHSSGTEVTSSSTCGSCRLKIPAAAPPFSGSNVPALQNAVSSWRIGSVFAGRQRAMALPWTRHASGWRSFPHLRKRYGGRRSRSSSPSARSAWKPLIPGYLQPTDWQDVAPAQRDLTCVENITTPCTGRVALSRPWRRDAGAPGARLPAWAAPGPAAGDA